MVKIPQFDEQTLVTALKAGDRSAFNYFYETNRLKIYNRLYRMVQSEEVAEDLLQNTFINAWNRREHLREDLSLTGYLLRIAANQVNDYYKKAANDRKVQDQLMLTATELYDHIEDTINYKESRAILKEAIELLPPQRQKIFTLIKIDGKSYDEVSQLLGISTSTISDHIVKATKAIRAHLFRSEQSALVFVIAVLFRNQG